MSQAHEAPKTHVTSEVVSKQGAFKIIKMTVPGGEELPLHVAAMDTAIVVVAGEGRIMVGDTTFAAAPGAVIEIPRDAPHGVYADETLDFVLIQA